MYKISKPLTIFEKTVFKSICRTGHGPVTSLFIRRLLERHRASARRDIKPTKAKPLSPSKPVKLARRSNIMPRS